MSENSFPDAGSVLGVDIGMVANKTFERRMPS